MDISLANLVAGTHIGLTPPPPPESRNHSPSPVPCVQEPGGVCHVSCVHGGTLGSTHRLFGTLRLSEVASITRPCRTLAKHAIGSKPVDNGLSEDLQPRPPQLVSTDVSATYHSRKAIRAYKGMSAAPHPLSTPQGADRSQTREHTLNQLQMAIRGSVRMIIHCRLSVDCQSR